MRKKAAAELGAKRTYAGNALDGNLSNPFFETGEARVDFSDLRLLPLDQLLDDLRKRIKAQSERGDKKQHPNKVCFNPKTAPHLFLLLDDDRELCVGNAGVELAAHERGALVVLDVAHVFGLGNLDVLGKTLEGGERKYVFFIHTTANTGL